MPTYSYECSRCGKQFSLFQKMSEEPLEICTFSDCGGTVRRIIGAGSGIVFKGTGFYQTDFKNNRKKVE
ncbi:FmdB family zinc ribbon protein [Chitinivibrio alkaliphilus]|uniref:Regulatory protein, FmdB family n=1 Tax=Chitinivibrio alkaliphilus ACht1 TaxID=1313304 RepID=U7D854_9BACT|nr:FmdB family zinc ribbon protein [Chitinivibrio alkaliphilus]ERP31262.1 regulatory protein, FmdB family [Chitinivibrio alkaliphilus ACht1]